MSCAQKMVSAKSANGKGATPAFGWRSPHETHATQSLSRRRALSRSVAARRGLSSRGAAGRAPARRRRDRIRGEEGKPRSRSPTHGWRAGNATEVNVRKTDQEKEDKNAKRMRRRALNDAFRTTFRGGRVVVTSGVNALADAVQRVVFRKIRDFDAFDDENDPWGE